MSSWLFILPGQPYEVEAAEPITISGVISENTTWTRTESPYLVTGNILIEENVVLKIKPGTVVHFDGSGRHYIQVEGIMIAEGTSEDRITFKSNKENPGKEDWDSISIRAKSGNQSTFKYCIFQHAGWAVNVLSPLEQFPIFQHNIIDGCYNGLRLESTSDLNPIDVVHNTRITSNKFSNTFNWGFLFDIKLGNYQFLNIEVDNNTIPTKGTSLDARTENTNLTITDNIFSDTNEFDYGVYLSIGSGINNKVYFSRNIITENDIGIKLGDGNSILGIENNTIIKNNIGIYLHDTYDRSKVHFINNIITGNNDYNVENSAPLAEGDWDFRYNWWGSTDKATIEKKIMHYYDDFKYSKILFEPFLVEPSPDAPDPTPYLNKQPDVPSKPIGPSSGFIGESLTFSTNTIDPDGDQIKYGWDWDGDGSVDEWSDLIVSGTPDDRSHFWTSQGTYDIAVKSIDELNEESGWSDSLTVTISQEEIEMEGSGTAEDPYKISNVNQLQSIQNDLDAYYVITNDIDASFTSTWNSGKGFKPIAFDTDTGSDGFQGSKFTGNIDGQNNKISNIFIDFSSEYNNGKYIGLFGSIGKGGKVSNIDLVDVSIKGDERVGGIVGWNDGGEIIDCSVSGALDGYIATGGITGYSDDQGTISKCSASVYVTGSGSLGGIVGLNEATVTECTSKGTIGVTGDHHGGIVGFNRGTVSDSSAECTINGTNHNGGIVGNNEGTISSSHAISIVSGKTHYNGGFVGENQGTITNCYSITEIAAEYSVGGFIGLNQGTVESCFSSGIVTGSGSVGGFIGENNANSDKITNSYSTCSVNGEMNIGGFIGSNSGEVTYCYSSGMVSGDSIVGGFTGGNGGGTVTKCLWNTETSGLSESSAGTGKTTTEMKTKSTYTNEGWDFNTIWNINEGESFAFLQWDDREAKPGVLYPPMAAINRIIPRPAFENENVYLEGFGTDTDGIIVGYEWTSSIDGLIATTASVTVNNLTVGNHTLSFRVRDNDGLWSDPITAEMEIKAIDVDNKPPTAIIESISPNPAKKGEEISFSGIGNDEDGSITSYVWTSSLDGIFLESTSGSVSTLSVGNHNIIFTVQDDSGAWSVDVEELLTIYEEDLIPPVAIITDISPNPANEGEEVTFSGSGSDEDGSVVSYRWHSSIDGVILESETGSLDDLSVGNHTITFRVQDDTDIWSAEVSAFLTILNDTDTIDPDDDDDDGPSDGPDDGTAGSSTGTGVNYGRIGVVVTSLVLIIGVLLIFMTEAGRFGMYGFFGGLTNREEKLKDNDTRWRIMGYIMDSPGSNYTKIKNALNLPNGTLAYHLRFLEKKEKINSKNEGKLKKFYPASMKVPRSKMDNLNKTQKNILTQIEEKPGMTQSQFAKKLGIDRSNASKNLKGLEEEELIRSVRVKKAKRYYPIISDE